MNKKTINEPQQDDSLAMKEIIDMNNCQNCGGNEETQACKPDNLVSSEDKKNSNYVTSTIRIVQMDCPTEEVLIRNKLINLPFIKNLEFNLIQRTLTIEHEKNALASVLASIRELDFDPVLQDQLEPRDSQPNQPNQSWLPLAFGGLAAIMSEIISWTGAASWLSACFAFVAIIVCGFKTYKKGWIAIRNLNLNINALMSIAVTGAMLIQQWPEAAMVMVLFSLAELIEAKSLDRARNAITSLMDLSPDTASVLQPDGEWKQTELNNVAIDNIVRVKPGERIGLDGQITRGRSAISQAAITGESLPVDKVEGDMVFAGSINESGSFDFRVTATANDSTVARIIKIVEEAQGVRAPTQRFVDQFSRVYTPTIFAIAIAVALIPPIFLSGSWQEWLYKALVLLVIACPCALVISTPVTIVSGLTSAARRGILIKGGVYLEEGRKLAWLALDKTGTLTYGKPVKTDFELRAKLNEERCNVLALSLAKRSDHPVSKAIVHDLEMKYQSESVESFEAILGRGVSGTIGGMKYFLGNHRLVEELTQCSTALEARLVELEQQGKSVVMLSDEVEVLALFAVADTVKETSLEAVSLLHDQGIKTAMLTGDNIHTAQVIGKIVGIDEVHGNQLPDDKLKAIEGFLKDGVVGMVGDGINDAPALARADIGFAMGGIGSDTAIETADVAIMDDDLRKIPVFVNLSKTTHKILLQNITIALGIKSLFLALTFAGIGTMWMAVFADMGASLIVMLNGLRLLNFEAND